MSNVKTPFPRDPRLSGITVAYSNRRLIADDVLPRVTVGQQEFRWMKFAQEERFTVPNTNVGRKSRVNQTEFGATEDSASTRDYGLEDGIPQADIENAPDGHDPLGHATEGLTDLIVLDREIRTANLVMNAANYPTGRKVTLSGTDQWTDQANSDPIGDIHAGQDAPLMPPNIAVMGKQAWRALQTHPQIVKAINRNSGDTGIVDKQAVAALFELDDIYVGEGWVNTAREGASPSYARVWPSSVALLHRNRLANTRMGVTFGYTAQWGGRIAGQWEDRNIGLRGGTMVRVGESVVELIVAADVGYLIKSVA